MRSRNESFSSAQPSCRRGRRLLSQVLGCGLLLTAAAANVTADIAQAAPASFAALLADFGTSQGLEARFEEEKFLALLAAPLHSRGVLFFDPPATLLRRIEEPRSQDILVTRTHVRITSGDEVQVIDLSGVDAVRPLIESMLWIFTGDRESLERNYEVDFRVIDKKGATPLRWQVGLVPRHPPLTDLIRELRVSGAGAVADTMELFEVTGDRTVTHIIDAKPRTSWSPAEQRALSGTEPK